MTTGTVKWFNDDKGSGFIAADDHASDLFAHHSAIVGEGHHSLPEGARVTLRRRAERQRPTGDQRPTRLSRRPPTGSAP